MNPPMQDILKANARFERIPPSMTRRADPGRHYQAVEKQPENAAKDGCDDEAIASAIDSSGASPDTCRTGDLKNAQDACFSTPCQMIHGSTMDILYMGTDADFVYRLDQRLAEEGFNYRIRIDRPNPSVAEHATAYLVEVDRAEWRRALETSDSVLIDRRHAGERQVAAAQAFAADQANKRGRMEAAFIFALVLGGVIGFMAYPMAVKPPVCPRAPPMFPDAPPQPLPLSPPSG